MNFSLNTDAFFIPEGSVHGPRLRLSKPISAIQLVAKEDGRAKLGLLSQLGPGTVIEHCGNGFNERTAKVRWNSSYYFVFMQDIESPSTATTL